MRKTIIGAMQVAVAMIVVAAVVALPCSCNKTAQTDTTAPLKTMVIENADRTLLTEYTARLSGRQVVEVRPQISGLITRICIAEGEHVSKGQELFIIDQAPYIAALKEAVAAVKSAEASLANARLDFESAETLYQNGVVGDHELASARNTLASAEASLAQAQAQEETAQTNLSYTIVKSPVDGVAGMIAYRVGALVDSNIDTPLVTVSDGSVMHAYFSMTESRIIDFTEQYGSVEKMIETMPEVSLRMSNGKEYSQKGRIGAVSGIVSPETGAVTLRADFPNSQGILRDGGNAAVIVPTDIKDCIVIPQAATFELQDRIFAYKIENGLAVSVPVEVFRLNNGTEYVVTSGLCLGDTIVKEGAGLVKEGARVR